MDPDTLDPQLADSTPDGPPAGLTMSANQVNALIHLYRGEVGRLTAYRTRLDTTTNWAITTSGLVGTFALGNRDVSHLAFLFLMLLVYFFLLLESRRMRYYEISRVRVQLFERNFFPAVLDRKRDPDWVDQILALYQQPTPPVGWFDAIGWRLRRNYLWIFLVILLAWVAKLGLAGGWAVAAAELVSRAAVGAVPGWLVAGLVAAFYAWLLFLTVRTYRHNPGGADW